MQDAEAKAKTTQDHTERKQSYETLNKAKQGIGRHHSVF
jgi:hypothetical protein